MYVSMIDFPRSIMIYACCNDNGSKDAIVRAQRIYLANPEWQINYRVEVARDQWFDGTKLYIEIGV